MVLAPLSSFSVEETEPLGRLRVVQVFMFIFNLGSVWAESLKLRLLVNCQLSFCLIKTNVDKKNFFYHFNLVILWYLERHKIWCFVSMRLTSNSDQISEPLWLQEILFSMEIKCDAPIILHSDIFLTINLANNLVWSLKNQTH